MSFSLEHKQKLFFLLLTILWAGFIYFLSDQPDLKTTLPVWYDLVLRKIGHMFVFAVLTYLLAKIFIKHNKLTIFFIILLAILYAVSDETHQLNVAGRHGSAGDILIDSFGVLLGMLFVRRKYYFKYFRK